MPLKRYVCLVCGEAFALDARLIRGVLFDGSNLEPRWRIVSANGRVLHRCGGSDRVALRAKAAVR